MGNQVQIDVTVALRGPPGAYFTTPTTQEMQLSRVLAQPQSEIFPPQTELLVSPEVTMLLNQAELSGLFERLDAVPPPTD